MTARVRKLIGGVGILVFLALYARTAAVLFERVPDVAWLKLAYMAVVGIAWGVPLIPLLQWMNRGRT